MFQTSGYWGAPTSSIDFCEANYSHSFYVAEFFNSLSSSSMVIAGALGLWLHFKSAETRLRLAFVLLAVVGIGSIVFHATLHFEHQMLDELPMLYLAIVMTYVLVENQRAPRFGIWFPVALTLHAGLVTYLCAFTRGRLQFSLFHVSFGSLELFGLFQMFRLARVSLSADIRLWFRYGMSAYVIAIVCWFADLKICSLVSPFRLHAAWHVLVSLGMYFFLTLLVSHRATLRNERAELGSSHELLHPPLNSNTPTLG